MIQFTLTPEARVYATALIAVSAMSCGAIADYATGRWIRPRARVFLPAYLVVMAIVVLFALCVLDLPIITALNGVTAALLIPLGIGAGIAADTVGAQLKRTALRRWPQQQHGGFRFPRTSAPASSNAAPRFTSSYRPSVTTRLVSAAGSFVPYQDLTGVPASRSGSLAVLAVAGALEEVLFRGVMVQLCLALGSPVLVVPCLTGTVLVFALSHLRLGYDEVFAKLGLGFLGLGAVLITGSVLPAVVGHVYLNVRAWDAIRLHAPQRAPGGAA